MNEDTYQEGLVKLIFLYGYIINIKYLSTTGTHESSSRD